MSVKLVFLRCSAEHPLSWPAWASAPQAASWPLIPPLIALARVRILFFHSMRDTNPLVRLSSVCSLSFIYLFIQQMFTEHLL